MIVIKCCGMYVGAETKPIYRDGVLQYWAFLQPILKSTLQYSNAAAVHVAPSSFVLMCTYWVTCLINTYISPL